MVVHRSSCSHVDRVATSAMSRGRRNIRCILFILTITTIPVTVICYRNWHLIVRPMPKGGWKTAHYSLPENPHSEFFDEMGFESVNIRGVPLDQVLQNFVRNVNEGLDDSKWTYQITDQSIGETPITLAFTNVRSSEVLRYATLLSYSKYILTEDRVIKIVPMNYVEPRIAEIMEGDYPYISKDHEVLMKKRGPHDIRGEIAEVVKNLGGPDQFHFDESDSARYFPREYRVRIQCSNLKHEEVDLALSSYCIRLKPTLVEKFKSAVGKLNGKISPPSPVPIPSPPPVNPFWLDDSPKIFQKLKDLNLTNSIFGF